MIAPPPSVVLDNVRLTLTGGSGPVNVLRGLSLSLPAGGTASVVGPSGSGKTTMLMVIAGLERPTSGRVLALGRELNNLSEDELARFRRGRIGIVFQAFHLIPTMTALENTALPLELAGDRLAMDKARAALVRVGLTGREDHYPSQLSGGEQQRAAVARAFVGSPALLLADEPTGNLDAETGAMVVDLLFALQAATKATMLLITHDQRLAARCGQCLVMRDGRIIEAEPGPATPRPLAPKDGRP